MKNYYKKLLNSHDSEKPTCFQNEGATKERALPVGQKAAKQIKTWFSFNSNVSYIV